MEGGFRTRLWINKADIELNPFVEDFLRRISIAAVSSLKGVETINTLDIQLVQDEVTVTLNDVELPLTPFPKDLISRTLKGLVSGLKGVDGIQRLRVYLEPSE